MSGFKIALVVIVIPLMLAGTPVAAQDSGGNGNRAKQGEVNPEPRLRDSRAGRSQARGPTPKLPSGRSSVGTGLSMSNRLETCSMLPGLPRS